VEEHEAGIHNFVCFGGSCYVHFCSFFNEHEFRLQGGGRLSQFII